MERYVFLFAVALIWIVFATVQDIKKREVANWLNFSLVAFALSYRLFYAVNNSDYWFFAYGVSGWLMFVVLGYIFYYGKVFAGGDSKLLMALGAILPFESLFDLFYISLGFLFLLFLIGTVYSVIYSLFISINSGIKFIREFKIKFRESKIVWIVVFCLILLLFIIEGTFDNNWTLFGISSLGILAIGVLYVYLMAVDKCMVELKNYKDLQEGDWLVKDVKFNGKNVRKSVHGLSKEEIVLLRKYRKSVYVKNGIPFVPVFLLTFIMVSGISTLGLEVGKIVLESLSLFFEL